MHIQLDEMSAVLNTFRLPSLHPDIPLKAIITTSEIDDSQFVKDLIKAKIITPESIPETASSTLDILYHGMKAWFDQRTQSLDLIRFSITIKDGEKTKEILEIFQDYEEDQFSDWYSLCLEGYEPRYFELESKALIFEQEIPNLMSTALDTIEIASCLTVPILTPNHVFADYCRNHWEESGDGLVPEDEEVRLEMIEKFGDEESITPYLPSAIVPVFGDSICLSDLKQKRKTLSLEKLKSISKSKSHLSEVAKQILKLKRSISIARKNRAYLPDLSYIDAESICFGCSLIYKEDDRVFDAIDDLVNMPYDSGYGTEVLGIQSLPSELCDLKTKFKKYHLAFNVLHELDKLLALITTPI